jgi:hypothetical protein
VRKNELPATTAQLSIFWTGGRLLGEKFQSGTRFAMNSHNYLGRTFEVWNGQRSWFWMVTEPGRDGGTIGAAESQVDAMRAACLSIEESASAPLPEASDSIVQAFLGWERMLSNLARHVARDCCAAA